ncbi:MAG: MogA/MoaB family molybdenum cofactor biosynthesis protein [Anaerolineae bacterium]
MRIAILTVSDRSAQGERPDSSGPLIAEIVQQTIEGTRLVEQAIVPDERNAISAHLIAWSDSGKVDVIFTTGGTGFAPRDVTPEATRLVLDREAPGMAEAMRAASLQKTPHAMLSRAVCGIRGRTLIINLPGSPKAVRENLEVVLPVLPHAVQLLHNAPDAEAGHTAHSTA